MANRLAVSIAEALALTFLQAQAQQQDVMRQWRNVGWRLGPRLPHSLLAFSIQQQGQTDAIIRCIEDEFSNPQRRARNRRRYDSAVNYVRILDRLNVRGFAFAPRPKVAR
jgi:hypothetical protein